MTSQATSSIHAVLVEGHKIASGAAEDSPYPDGSIAMQTPYFKKHGVDISTYHSATLNLSIAPQEFKMLTPEFTVKTLHWAEGFPPEDFSFSKCEVIFNNKAYKGLIYYPHPETKIGHFHNTSLIEVITDYILNIKYGDDLVLKFNPIEININ